MFDINEKFKSFSHKTVWTIYSDTNGTYLCWDKYDKYYYFGQKEDGNIIHWDSLEALKNFYAIAIKNLSIMKIPNLCLYCAIFPESNFVESK